MIVIDIPVNPIPHVCVHVRAPKGRRAFVSDGDALDRRKVFQDEVRLQLPRAARTGLAGRVRVVLKMWRQCRRGADGDNLQKEVLDAFTKAGVWVDDKQVRGCSWDIVAEGPEVEPRIYAEIHPLEALLEEAS